MLSRAEKASSSGIEGKVRIDIKMGRDGMRFDGGGMEQDMLWIVAAALKSY